MSPDGAFETPDGVVDRLAARLLVLDEHGAVLLLKGTDPARPDRGTWWFTPGGGVDDGESLADAARRELHEETGLIVADVGSPVFDRELHFDFEWQHFRQSEHFFVVHTRRFAIDEHGWTDVERRSILGHRWWTPDEIAASSDAFFPENLFEMVGRANASSSEPRTD